MWFELENGHYINLDNVVDIGPHTYKEVGNNKPQSWTKADFKHCLNAIKRKGRLAVYDKKTLQYTKDPKELMTMTISEMKEKGIW